ncbi:hypothetical protein [Algisphaera agarilytica]|uniref:Uncharacterized protein n=1 Tax=Algisphaera agarilytica TaxID=1385975 RepID=A0A7X0H5T2_9BACT|nr:hypothetical protein [Algisphaera agarilytica]MBB6429785.1 hypothetical protein [Algisphaera agarilytica]
MASTPGTTAVLPNDSQDTPPNNQDRQMMLTQFLGQEQVRALLLDMCTRFGPELWPKGYEDETYRPVIVLVGESGHQLYEALVGWINEYNADTDRPRWPWALYNASYIYCTTSRNKAESGYRYWMLDKDEYGKDRARELSSEDLAKAVATRSVLVFDGPIHHGTTMRKIIRHLETAKPDQLYSYALFTKRNAQFVPTAYGLSIPETHRLYYSLNKIPQHFLGFNCKLERRDNHTPSDEAPFEDGTFHQNIQPLVGRRGIHLEALGKDTATGLDDPEGQHGHWQRRLEAMRIDHEAGGEARHLVVRYRGKTLACMTLRPLKLSCLSEHRVLAITRHIICPTTLGTPNEALGTEEKQTLYADLVYTL